MVVCEMAAILSRERWDYGRVITSHCVAYPIPNLDAGLANLDQWENMFAPGNGINDLGRSLSALRLGCKGTMTRLLR